MALTGIQRVSLNFTELSFFLQRELSLYQIRSTSMIEVLSDRSSSLMMQKCKSCLLKLSVDLWVCGEIALMRNSRYGRKSAVSKTYTKVKTNRKRYSFISFSPVTVFQYVCEISSIKPNDISYII